MRTLRSFKFAAAALLMAGALAACGDAGDDDEGGGTEVEVEEDCDPGKFEEGTRMAELAEAGSIIVGVRYDQPGLGFFDEAVDEIPSGFDVEMAKLLVADLCIDPEDPSVVTYEETISDNRERFLQTERVDLVAASYSITDERRGLVGQAGPYFLTGQQVLVPEDSDIESIDDLQGEEVCSASGSTSLDNVNDAGAVGVPADTYSICAEQVNDGSVPAMSTDGSILLGLAAQYDGSLKVVGEEFSEERIGVGYPPAYPEMCQWITDVLQASYDDDTWAGAFEATLGASGSETPDPPELDPCS